MLDCGDDYLELGRKANEAPAAPALGSSGRETLSWAELWRHVLLASEEFVRCGIVPRGVAALALPSGPEFLSAFLAITLRSACAPLDPGLTANEYRFQLSKINAGTLVFAEGVNVAVMEAARELGLGLIRIRPAEGSVAGVFLMEPIATAVQITPRRETDAAVLLHTSATTDHPKLVPLSRGNLRAVILQDVRALELSASDRYLSLTPLCHAHGLLACLSQFYCGGSVFADSAIAPANLLESFRRARPTWISAGVPVLRILLSLASDHPDASGPEAFLGSPLRFVRSTGSSPELALIDAWQRIAGVPLLNGYGLTEAPGVTRNTRSMSRQGSAGKSSGAELAVRDDDGNLRTTEAEGEIVLRGPAVTAGYQDDPQANLEAFRDGWFHTGDIGRIDRDGFLFIAGRKKETIGRGGKRILPLEVDNVLLSHPALADAATFPIPHRTLEQEPAAALVLRPGAEASELELRRFAAAQLAAYKVPRKIVFLEQIPRSTTGKPKRAALAERFRELGSVGQASRLDRPPTEIEEKLIAIWRRVLGIERGVECIAPDDDFFDWGGDSLSATLMLAQAGEAFGLSPSQLTQLDFFEHPTVSTLAGWIIERAGATRREPVLQNRILVLQSAGKGLPIFCFSTSEEDAYKFRYLSRWLGPAHPFTVVCPPHPVQDNRLRTVEEIARQSVASIRALRPSGPVVIAGYCYGGAVAFEVARQLKAEGGQVALLALIETPTPGFPKIMRAWRAYSRALGSLVRRGARQPEKPDIWHSRMLWRYRPQIFNAPIVHFVGADVRVSTRILSDPRLGWRHFAGEGFEARVVPGDHVSILSESRSPALAAEFESVLRALNSAAPAEAAVGASV
jgi:acyl-CoA synthetase (AMP-forming)/AMP-acid ligase II/thioesterase domain-containing protein/acyl carrier protein